MIEIVITSSALITIVILLRTVFRGKISRRLRYVLWIPVMLRLLLPFPLIESPVSVMNALHLSGAGFSASQLGVPARPLSENTPGDYTAESGTPVSETGDSGLDIAANERASMPVADSLRIIWMCGAAVSGLWLVIANAAFYQRLRKNRTRYQNEDCRLPLYEADFLPSPCLFGVFRPAVYLTSKAAMSEESTRHVITHELCHYAHGDHIWSLLRGLCLALHWFNPLVWVAAALSRTDCELACDEAAVKRLGGDSRIAYGRTLVNMIALKGAPAALMCTATTMTSGKRGIKERIEMIVKGQRTLIPALMATLLVVALAVGCTFTGAKGGKSEPSPLAAKIEAGLSDPDPLVRQAWSMIRGDIERNEESSGQVFPGQGTRFTDAEITKLELSDRFDDIYEDAIIEVYRLEYRMLPIDMSKIMLAGGMSTQEGWLLSTCSMGNPYLVAKVVGADRTYLGTVYPEGEGQGVLDTTLELLTRLEAQDVPNAPSAKQTAAVASLLKKFSITSQGEAEWFDVTVAQSWNAKLGEYPVGMYWAMANEVSKDAGYDLAPLKGKTVKAWRARMATGLQSRERTVDHFYPSDVIALLDGDTVVGAWLSWNTTTIGPSLRKQWFEDVTGLSFEQWAQRQGYFSDPGENGDLATMRPEQVLDAFFKAINEGNKTRAYACLTPSQMLSMLSVNRGPNRLYNPGPGTNNSLVENIVSGRMLSWHYYDPEDVAVTLNDIAGRTRVGVAVEVEIKWRDDAFNTSDGRQPRFAMMFDNGLGWKLGGLGTGP